MAKLACDVSNYTRALTAQNLADWKAAGVALVIVQLLTDAQAASTGRSYTRQQLQACQDAGMPVDGYVYLYPGQDLRPRLAMADGFTLHRKWLDLEETGLSASNVTTALGQLDAYPAQVMQAGIYSGKWWFDAHMPNHPDWSDRPLWDSNYDGIADTAIFHPYAGWRTCFIKQYVGSTSLAGVGGIDLNVLSAVAEAELSGPAPAPEPEPQEAVMAIKVGQGIKDRMTANQDAPLFGHRFYGEVDDDGKTYTVEECFGSKGRYVSSNSSGQWVNAGPIG